MKKEEIIKYLKLNNEELNNDEKNGTNYMTLYSHAKACIDVLLEKIEEEQKDEEN